MTEAIRYAVERKCAVLCVANPPHNALSGSVRAGLIAAFDRACEDADADAIVLAGDGKTFPAGVELAEDDGGDADPSLRALCQRVERSEKPVVAVLSGSVLGGGFELALAAHYRVAAQGTRMALPGVRLGLPPSAGGSQRLPRLVGAQPALALLLRAEVVAPDTEAGRALVDAVVEGDPRAGALRFAAGLLAEHGGPRRLSALRDGFADMAAYMRAVEAARAALPDDPDSAPARILKLVEAAPLLPFEAGLAMEEDMFEACRDSDVSRALRHVFLAERRARRFRVATRMTPPRVDRLAVLGGGPLAIQIVAAALSAGLPVNWGTRDSTARDEGARRLRAFLEQAQQDAAAGLMGRLATGDSAAMVQGADLVLHAARGQGDVPAPPQTVRAVAMPARVDEIGLRVPLPVFRTRLMEVIEGPGCRPEQVAALLGLADRLGRIPVQVRSDGESLAGRLGAVLHRAADALVDLGVGPGAVDAALRAAGWPLPPFEGRDRAGLAEYAQARRAAGARNWSSVLIEAGRTGRAAKAGFYDWTEDGPVHSASVDGLVPAPCAAAPIAPERILALLTGAMAAEGARLLESGMAQRASDLDVVAVHALGFPRWRGGPMKAASLHGLFRLQTAMDRLDHPDSTLWKVGDLWRDLVKNGRDFDAA
jgi:3-hydroxyacyl-CoA dehydrogenase